MEGDTLHMVAVVPEPDLLSIGHDDNSGIENAFSLSCLN